MPPPSSAVLSENVLLLIVKGPLAKRPPPLPLDVFRDSVAAMVKGPLL